MNHGGTLKNDAGLRLSPLTGKRFDDKWRKQYRHLEQNYFMLAIMVPVLDNDFSITQVSLWLKGW